MEPRDPLRDPPWAAARSIVLDLIRKPIVIHRCVQTCWARPSQWECQTTDGAAVYLRHRDHGSVGLGPSPDDAVNNTIYEFDEGGWSVTLEEFASYLPDWLQIDTSDETRITPFSEEHLGDILPVKEEA